MNDPFEIVGVRPELLERQAPEKENRWYQGVPWLSVIVLLIIAGGCLFCKWIMSKDPSYMDLKNYTVAPCREFLFGTDTMGRDIFSMIWYGGRQSLFIGFVATMIYVSHDESVAMTLGTKIVVMKDGIIQQVDTPQNLYNYPQNLFVAGFIGSPQMNFIDVAVAKEDGKVVLKMKENKFVLPEDKAKEVVEQGYLNKTVTMGIRPENIYDPKELVEVKKGAELNVKINVYELLGSEVYLYFDLENFPMTARVNADTTARMGDKVKFIMDMEKVHIFDKETGIVITN